MQEANHDARSEKKTTTSTNLKAVFISFFRCRCLCCSLDFDHFFYSLLSHIARHSALMVCCFLGILLLLSSSLFALFSSSSSKHHTLQRARNETSKQDVYMIKLSDEKTNRYVQLKLKNKTSSAEMKQKKPHCKCRKRDGAIETTKKKRYDNSKQIHVDGDDNRQVIIKMGEKKCSMETGSDLIIVSLIFHASHSCSIDVTAVIIIVMIMLSLRSIEIFFLMLCKPFPANGQNVDNNVVPDSMHRI